MSCGGYPLGAQYDPRAPYNQKDPEMVTCPYCDGTGHLYWAFNIRTRQSVKVLCNAYYCLPETEELAEALNQNYCKDDDMECETCNGYGEVEVEEEEYEPDDRCMYDI